MNEVSILWFYMVQRADIFCQKSTGWHWCHPLRNLRQADRPVYQLRTTRPRVCRLTHFLLYFIVLAMPISGYMGNGSGVNYGIFQVKPFMETSIANWIYNTFGIPFDIFHYGIAGPFIIWVLVLLHVIAAIYHHTMLKDNVLKRMLPSKSWSKVEVAWDFRKLMLRISSLPKRVIAQ